MMMTIPYDEIEKARVIDETIELKHVCRRRRGLEIRSLAFRIHDKTPNATGNKSRQNA